MSTVKLIDKAGSAMTIVSGSRIGVPNIILQTVTTRRSFDHRLRPNTVQPEKLEIVNT